MKYKGVIIEGCDCSGKTTLAKKLKTVLSAFGWDVIDLGHQKTNQFDRYMKFYLSATQTIFDRAHFSEIAYGNLWRGGRHFEQWQIELLNSIAFNDFIVVFTHASPKVLSQRFHTRNYQQIISEKELELLQNEFSKLLNKDTVLLYEAKDDKSLDNLIDLIMDKLETKTNSEELLLKTPDNQISEKDSFIILEGANGSGKSTLAKLLKVSMVGWSIKTLDYKFEPPFHRYLNEYVLGMNTIFDRSHISEIIYSRLFKRTDSLSSAECEHLNRFIVNRSMVILCNPPVETLIERVSNAQYPKHINIARLEQLKSDFIGYLETHNIPYYKVDTTNPHEIENTIRLVTSRIKSIPYSKMKWDS